MIAAAMANRKHSVPRYADLGKSNAQIERRLEPQGCERLHDATLGLEYVETALEFALDDQARVHVRGNATARVAVECQLCTEAVTLDVGAEIEGLLARDEAQAHAWQDQDSQLNIIVVAGAELDVSELVEDELILNLPSRVCVDDTCEARPAMDYAPAAQELAHVAQGAADAENPFAVLEKLKSPGQEK